ncbi:MAG: carbohydrate ABC transporter permease [Candidatus Excrementavichristensenella sp.]|jgi:putative aldouronate transport system permease protein|nr:carbohydrate ABC transporter permease [Bacillota bacterium]NLL54142.1 carbohydrate ABC transporter permease [Clostridiales bacterium]
MKRKKEVVIKENPMRFYTLADKVVLGLTTFVLLLFFVVLLYPLLYAVISSFAKGVLPLNLIPTRITLEGYIACIEYRYIWTGFRNSVIYTLLGTGIALLVTICCAYALSVKHRLRGLMLAICMFTMYFDGGLIPNFLWINKLGLYNTVWALVLPGALSVYNMLVMRTYFENSIPAELHEAAQLDGASEIGYLIRVVVPLSGAVIAVIALYYISSLWNSYFQAMLYIQDLEKLPLSNILRSLLLTAQNAGLTTMDSSTAQKIEERQEVMKYCVIVVSSVPMLVLYPFIQKYFVKGVMIGAVKG